MDLGGEYGLWWYVLGNHQGKMDLAKNVITLFFARLVLGNFIPGVELTRKEGLQAAGRPGERLQQP